MDQQSINNNTAADLPSLPVAGGQDQYLYAIPVPQATQPTIANTPLQEAPALHMPGESPDTINLNLPSMADDVGEALAWTYKMKASPS